MTGGHYSRCCYTVGMHTRTLGQGLEVSEQGLGCMGMSAWYGATDEQEVDRDDPPGDRARRLLPRHRRHVRRSAGRQRAARRQGDRGTARRGRARDEVRQRPRRRRQAQRQRQARVRARRRSTLAQAAGRRPRRPLLPAPRRQDRADRGDGRRDGGARRGRQGAAPRPLGGVAGDDPPRARGAPDHGAADRSTRSGRATPRTTRCSTPCASSGSGSSPTRRSAAASSPGSSARPTTSPTTTSAATSRASRARTSSGTSTSSRGSRRSRRRKASRRRSSRSRGCSRAATTSCRSRARSGGRYLEENAGAGDVELSADDLARIEEAFPKDAARGRPLRGHVDDRFLD